MIPTGYEPRVGDELTVMVRITDIITGTMFCRVLDGGETDTQVEPEGVAKVIKSVFDLADRVEFISAGRKTFGTVRAISPIDDDISAVWIQTGSTEFVTKLSPEVTRSPAPDLPGDP